MVIGHLDITSWRGISIGAVHWYVSIIIDEGDKLTETIELTRPLTSAEAKALNVERAARGYFSRHKAGDKTTGFNTEEDAINTGIQYFKAHYTGVLLDGDYACYSAWKKVIVYPNEFAPLVKEMNDLADRFQKLNGYECDRKHAKLVERLDQRWAKRYTALRELCKP